jgi:RNA polymerase-binding transcription factor DksA
LDIAAVVCLVLAVGLFSGFAKRRSMRKRVIRGAARPSAVVCKLCGQEIRAEEIEEVPGAKRCLECGQSIT